MTVVAAVSDEQRTPRENAETFALHFRGQANHLAMQFGGPLYLVGSMLTSQDPGDIDLRLAIAREDLEVWFGDDNVDCHGAEWGASSFRRTREELKVSRRMTRRWCATNRTSRPARRWATRIDFQFAIVLFADGQPIWGGAERPRLRLDSIPLDNFGAGRGEP